MMMLSIGFAYGRLMRVVKRETGGIDGGGTGSGPGLVKRSPLSGAGSPRGLCCGSGVAAANSRIQSGRLGSWPNRIVRHIVWNAGKLWGRTPPSRGCSDSGAWKKNFRQKKEHHYSSGTWKKNFQKMDPSDGSRELDPSDGTWKTNFQKMDPSDGSREVRRHAGCDHGRKKTKKTEILGGGCSVSSGGGPWRCDDDRGTKVRGPIGPFVCCVLFV